MEARHRPIEAFVVELHRGPRTKIDIAWTARGADEALRLTALANPGWEPTGIRQTEVAA